MRVLLTGGSGFLGKYVQRELASNGIEYIVYNRQGWGTLEEKANLRNFALSHPSFSHVIHLAAKVGGIGANLASPYDFIASNLNMGLSVIENARAFGWKVVMVSTICAYPSEPPNIPFIESDLWNGAPHPSNLGYGIAKRTLTEVLFAAYQQHGLKSVVLNLANLYGLGDNEDLEKSHVIPAMISKLRTAKENEEKVVFWGDGLCSRDFLFVRDAAKAVTSALDLEQGPRNGINIGTGRETSIVELAQLLCELLEVDPEQVTWDSSKDNGQTRRVLDCSVANDLLGWKSQTSLEEGLKELCSLEN